MPTLEEIRKFSVSKNFYLQVVSPLYRSNKVENLDGLLELLKKIHSSLWTKSGVPDGFSGAVAGNFQEILDGYAAAVVKGHRVSFGADERGVGGDTVKEIEVGNGRLWAETAQFKVSASHAGEIRHHICKAAWQLTGAGGETPKKNSQKAIEVIVQNPLEIEPHAPDRKPMAEFEVDDWKKQIAQALADGYDDQIPAKTSEELYAAVDHIYITTPKYRYQFMIFGHEILFMGGGAPFRNCGYVFKGGRINQHWIWLTNDFWNTIKWNGYDYMTVQKLGIPSGKPKTPSELPFQSAGFS